MRHGLPAREIADDILEGLLIAFDREWNTKNSF
jgi:hypothetical protein